MRLLFKLLIGASALFIAACGAFFSVRGLSLLFVGSAVSVMVMASSLEIGKLVAASLLYRYWKQINFFLRIYLVGAVIVLIGITSLGIYGYLARAYEQTNTHVSLLERQVQDNERMVADTQKQIDLGHSQVSRLDDAGRADVQKQQQIIMAADQSLEESLKRLEQRRQSAREKRDQDVQQQDQRLADAGSVLKTGLAAEEKAMADLSDRLTVLDRAVDAYTKEGGARFLKVDSIKLGQKLRDEQKGERAQIAKAIEQHQTAAAQLRAGYAASSAAVEQQTQAIRKEYDGSLAKLDGEEHDLRGTQAASVAKADAQLALLRSSDKSMMDAGGEKIDALYQRVAAGNEEIARLHQEIAATDVGSYRFVARAFNAPVDDVVKWLILLVVLVFDPLAVTLTVGFNVAMSSDRKPKAMAVETAGNGVPVGPAPTWASRWGKRAAVSLALLALAVCVGFGGREGLHFLQHRMANQHTRFIPQDSFAVATLGPAQLQGQAQGARSLMASVDRFVPEAIMGKLSELSACGFRADSNVYAFLTYPHVSLDKAGDRPVLMLGFVGAVDAPAVAEAALSKFSQSLAGVLLPGQSDRSGAARSRSMIQYGRGKYLDPDGGFFTFAVSDSVVVAMVELEGDPNHPLVEKEIRQCLANDNTDALGTTESKLPARATAGVSGTGTAALWFDAQRCFATMPKNAAAQNRYQQLERFLGFDVVLTVDPSKTGQLQVTGDYHYAVDKFDRDDRGDHSQAADALAKLGLPAACGVPGVLMDRCATTLDFESLIGRLRQTLAGPQTSSGSAQVVVQKIVDSQRAARFVLQANFDPQAQPTLRAAMGR